MTLHNVLCDVFIFSIDAMCSVPLARFGTQNQKLICLIQIDDLSASEIVHNKSVCSKPQSAICTFCV